MDFLTAETWNDLRFVGGVVAIYLGLVLAGSLFLRWRRKQPLLAGPDWRRMALDHGFFVAIFAMFVLQDVLERLGVPGWLSLLIFMGAVLAVCGFAFRRMKRGMDKTAAQSGMANPCAAPVGGVPLSREEKSVTLKMTALVLAACLAVIAPVIALALADFETGISGLAGMLAWCLVALGAVTWATVGRWPGRVALSSAIEIAATPQQVWSTIRYVPEQPYYKGIFRRVEKVDAPGETYLLHYYTEDDCSDCGLPKHPDTPGVTSLVEIVEAIEPRLYRLRSWPKTTDPVLKNSMDHEDESFLIEPLPGERCRVTNTSTLERPRVWLAALLKLGDPLGEHLRNLKAHIEGSPAGTIFETGAARIAAARVAERHCGCGELAEAA